MAKNYFESTGYTNRKVLIYKLVIINEVPKWKKVATVHLLDSEVAPFCDRMVADGLWKDDSVVAINQEGQKLWRKKAA